MPQQKTVLIKVAVEDLEKLKDSQYKLCFAKKVNGTYNVIWQSSSDYLENNTFSWTPSYMLFGTNTFQHGVTVDVRTNTVAVGLGQTAVQDAAGHIQDAYNDPTSPAESITLDNNYGWIHPGLLATSTDIDGRTSSTPIYVAQKPISQGSDALTPVESVQVWFEQDVATGTMFSIAKSNVAQIDLTTSNTATRLYKGGQWTIPAS